MYSSRQEDGNFVGVTMEYTSFFSLFINLLDIIIILEIKVDREK